MSALTNPSLAGTLSSAYDPMGNFTGGSSPQGYQGNPYGGLVPMTSQSHGNPLALLQALQAKSQVPQVGLNQPQAQQGGAAPQAPQSPNPGMGQAAGGLPTPPQRPANLMSAGQGQTQPQAQAQSQPGTMSPQGGTGGTGSPFDNHNPNSFISKIFGTAGQANQQPLVSNNSIVGRVAHLFMN